MKSKLLVILSTLLLALSTLALDRNAGVTQVAANDNAKACACCDQGKTSDGKVACVKGAGCCGKGAKCCGSDAKCCGGDSAMASKDGKAVKACPMMSKDKDGKSSCCADGKCPMMAKGNGKSCCEGQGCCGSKSAAAATSTQSKASCCAKGAACCSSGAACCGASVVTSAIPAHGGCCEGM